MWSTLIPDSLKPSDLPQVVLTRFTAEEAVKRAQPAFEGANRPCEGQSRERTSSHTILNRTKDLFESLWGPLPPGIEIPLFYFYNVYSVFFFWLVEGWCRLSNNFSLAGALTGRIDNKNNTLSANQRYFEHYTNFTLDAPAWVYLQTAGS